MFLPQIDRRVGDDAVPVNDVNCTRLNHALARRPGIGEGNPGSAQRLATAGWHAAEQPEQASDLTAGVAQQLVPGIGWLLPWARTDMTTRVASAPTMVDSASESRRRFCWQQGHVESC